MKSKSKRPKLKKYPSGGTVSPYGPTKTHPNALPANPTLDDYNKRIAGVGQMNVTTPGGVPGDIAAYTHDSIAIPMQGMQGQLNTALLKKYGVSDLSQIKGSMGLLPQEADAATKGQYAKFNQLDKAYTSYRDKTNLQARTSPEASVPSFGYSNANTLPLYDSTQIAKFSSYNKHAYGGTQNPYTGDPVTNAANEQEINSNNRKAQAGQIGNYASTALGAVGAYQQAQAQPGVKQSQRDANSVNGVIDTVASVATPWYGIAKSASGVGRSLIEKDAEGKANSAGAQSLDTFMTPMHEQVINDASKGDWGGAAIDFLGLGAVKDYMNYPMGGTTMNPNAEVEKQEVMRYPNGATTQVNGPTHEGGGVPVNIPNGTQIYSDRLKMPGTKKTFAQLAGPLKTAKQEKVLADDSANNTAKATARLIMQTKQRKLDQIFQAQESLKQSKVQAYAQKMGVTLPQSQSQPSGQFSGGGTKLPQYPWGANGEWIPDEPAGPRAEQVNNNIFNTNEDLISATNDLGVISAFGNNTVNNFDGTNQLALTANTARQANNYRVPNQNNYGETLPMVTNQDLENRNIAAMQLAQEQKIANSNESHAFVPPSNARQKLMDQDLLATGISAGLQSMGQLSDLVATRGGKNYDKEHYGQVAPHLLDPTASIRDANRQTTATRKALLANSGGNAGAYMANLAQINAGNTQTIDSIRKGYSNSNAEILNKSDWANKELQLRENSDTKQNKARSEDIARTALRGLGSNAGNVYKDYKAGQMDKNTASMISSMFANYKLDMNNPQHWEWIYKQLENKTKGPE